MPKSLTAITRSLLSHSQVKKYASYGHSICVVSCVRGVFKTHLLRIKKQFAHRSRKNGVRSRIPMKRHGWWKGSTAHWLISSLLLIPAMLPPIFRCRNLWPSKGICLQSGSNDWQWYEIATGIYTQDDSEKMWTRRLKASHGTMRGTLIKLIGS